jgi:hypothetical protein
MKSEGLTQKQAKALVTFEEELISNNESRTWSASDKKSKKH